MRGLLGPLGKKLLQSEQGQRALRDYAQQGKDTATYEIDGQKYTISNRPLKRK